MQMTPPPPPRETLPVYGLLADCHYHFSQEPLRAVGKHLNVFVRPIIFILRVSSLVLMPHMGQDSSTEMRRK